MKPTIENVSKLERKISFTIPLDEVQKEFQHAYGEVQKTVEIKGFRKGKAPLNVIKTQYKDRVYSHVIQHLVEENFWKTIDENSLNPINQPQLQLEHELEEDKPFSFSLTFEVHPEIEVKNYKGLKVKREKASEDSALVDKTLENIQKSRAEQVDVLEDRPAQKGDVAVINFEGFVNGEPLENGKGENHPLELGTNSFIAGFEEAVEGMKVGVTQEANIKFPETYHVTSLAGLPVKFNITLKALKKNKLPELNDEFAAQVGFKTMTELKEMIAKDNSIQEGKRIAEDFKNRLLKELTKQNPIEVPKTLLEKQKQALIEDMSQRMGETGLDEKNFNDYVQKWDKDFTETAEFIVQSSYIVNKVAEVEGLRATEKDVNDKINEYIQQTGIEESKIRSVYDSKENKSRLKNMITEEKVIAFLTAQATVQEVTKDKLD